MNRLFTPLISACATILKPNFSYSTTFLSTSVSRYAGNRCSSTVLRNDSRSSFPTPRPCRSGWTPIGPKCQWRSCGSCCAHTLIILNDLGSPQPTTRIIPGAAFSFSPMLSWQCGHCVAFRTPRTRPSSSASNTWLYFRPSLAARTGGLHHPPGFGPITAHHRQCVRVVLERQPDNVASGVHISRQHPTDRHDAVLFSSEF